MNLRIIAWLLFFPLTVQAQKADSVLLQGSIQIVSYHQGGAQLPYEFTLPKPYKTKMVLVKYVNDQTLPRVVRTIESDSAGHFEVYVTRGKYGFVREGDVKNLLPGQVLPPSNNTRGKHIYTNSYWSANQNLPLDLTKGETGSITLTYDNSSSCMDCP